jgi:hypothetical protein
MLTHQGVHYMFHPFVIFMHEPPNDYTISLNHRSHVMDHHFGAPLTLG